MINIRCTGVQIFQRIKKKTPRSWQYSVGFLCMCVKDCAYEKALVADIVQVFHCMSISSKSVWKKWNSLSFHHVNYLHILLWMLYFWEWNCQSDKQKWSEKCRPVDFHHFKSSITSHKGNSRRVSTCIFILSFSFLFSFNLTIASYFHIGNNYQHILNVVYFLPALVNVLPELSTGCFTLFFTHF